MRLISRWTKNCIRAYRLCLAHRHQPQTGWRNSSPPCHERSYGVAGVISFAIEIEGLKRARTRRLAIFQDVRNWHIPVLHALSRKRQSRQLSNANCWPEPLIDLICSRSAMWTNSHFKSIGSVSFASSRQRTGCTTPDIQKYAGTTAQSSPATRHLRCRLTLLNHFRL